MFSTKKPLACRCSPFPHAHTWRQQWRLRTQMKLFVVVYFSTIELLAKNSNCALFVMGCSQMVWYFKGSRIVSLNLFFRQNSSLFWARKKLRCFAENTPYYILTDRTDNICILTHLNRPFSMSTHMHMMKTAVMTAHTDENLIEQTMKMYSTTNPLACA